MIVGAFIVLWLLWQAWLPLAYYLGDDPAEERFAWRMFSDISVLAMQCEVSVTEWVGEPDGDGARLVDLGATLHAAWEGHLRLGRRLVIERVLESRCRRDPSVTEVGFRRTCPAGHESRRPPVDARLRCRTGAFTGPAGAAR